MHFKSNEDQVKASSLEMGLKAQAWGLCEQPLKARVQAVNTTS